MIMVVVGHVLDNKRTIDWKQYFLQSLIKSLQRFQPPERLLKFQCGIQNKNSINTQSTSLSFTLMNSALYSIEDKKLQIYVEIKIIFLFLNFYLLILRKREKNIDLLFHLFMHSLVDSHMCPDQGSNLQPWCIRMML